MATVNKFIVNRLKASIYMKLTSVDRRRQSDECIINNSVIRFFVVMVLLALSSAGLFG
jgi:hypothetical protein